MAGATTDGPGPHAPSPCVALCADVGGSWVDIAAMGANREVFARKKVPTPRDWPSFATIFAAAGAMTANADAPLAIATAGLVDPASGIVSAANVPAIDGRSLAAEVAAATGRRVTIVNDADAFTLAEARLGIGRGHHCAFGVVLGTGVGGGLVRDGEIVGGPHGVTGEWGHGQIIHRSPLAPHSAPLFACGCGQVGCLDTVSGARGLERLHFFLHRERRNSHQIVAAWRNHDHRAAATLDYFVEITAGAIAMIVNTVGASIVPVGGGLSTVAPLVERIDAHVRANMLVAPDTPLVRASALGDLGGIYGAWLAV